MADRPVSNCCDSRTVCAWTESVPGRTSKEASGTKSCSVHLSECVFRTEGAGTAHDDVHSSSSAVHYAAVRTERWAVGVSSGCTPSGGRTGIPGRRMGENRRADGSSLWGFGFGWRLVRWWLGEWFRPVGRCGV